MTPVSTYKKVFRYKMTRPKDKLAMKNNKAFGN